MIRNTTEVTADKKKSTEVTNGDNSLIRNLEVTNGKKFTEIISG